MGLLKDLVEKLTGKTVEEDEKTIDHLEQKGKNDADRIAKTMWDESHKKDFVSRVDVSLPVEIPTVEDKKEERQDEGR